MNLSSLPSIVHALNIYSFSESTTSGRFSSGLTTPDHEKKESGYYSSEEPKLPPVFLKKRRPLTATKLSAPPERPKERERSVESGKEEQGPCTACANRPSNMSERAKRYAALPIQVFGEPLVGGALAL